MTFETATIDHRTKALNGVSGTVFACFIAALGWISLAIEFDRSVTESLVQGHSVAEALFLYFRFFSILTNIGIAILMSVTVARLMMRRALPPTPLFNAGLIYILVTCVTYEVMLRSNWMPRGMQFFTDMAIHDIIPALTLIFWLAFAPRNGARWRDAFWVLVYPAVYFAVTLGAGALGEGYPYSFLNVSKLGLNKVLVIAVIFLAIFYALGLATTALSIFWDRHSEQTS